jgi:hypothetical protein
MLTRQHALKDSEKKEPKSTQISSSDKAKMSKNRKDDNTNECSKNPDQKEQDMNKMDKMFEMMKSMMVKLETLDEIKERILCVEKDVKQMKDSIEFVHAEVNDLKDEVEKTKRSDEENRRKIRELEDTNRRLQESVVDLKARSMRDNLLFFNVKEDEKENTTEKIYDILEQNLEIFDARNKVKIDRSHRVGRKRVSQRKPRAIVVKFNYFQDREQVRQNARKLKGTRIGIAEQFPKEIEKIRQTFYPEMKKAKAQGHRVRLVRDRLYINNVEFKPSS